MPIREINLDAWGDEDISLLAEIGERLASEAAPITERWTRRLAERSTLGRYPEAMERITEINRWFLESYLHYLRERDLRGLLESNFEGDVALLRAQLEIDPELRSTLGQLYLSLEISTEAIVDRLQTVFSGDPRLARILLSCSRLALALGEAVGLAFYEVRSSELRNALRIASSLAESSGELNQRASSLSDVLTHLTRIVTRLLHCDHALVYLWRPSEEAYVAEANLGFSAADFAAIQAIRLRPGDFPLVDRIMRGEAVSGGHGDGQVPNELTERFGVRAYAVAPMKHALGGQLGMIATHHTDDAGFDLTDVRILEGVAGNAALAIESATLVARLEAQADELTRSNQELENFAYVASHDLQEPLRTVASFVQLLARRYRGKLDADADDYIGYAVDGAVRMQALIHDLLTYSRVGRMGKELVPNATEPAFEQALRNLGTAVEESQAIVTHDALPSVVADRSELVQLFQNLIGNAIKFRRTEPPRVHVSARREAGEWHFSVTDNGIGIDSRYASRLFEIFQRLHGRNEYPGTGIGLAICKKIVERCGGRIWFESEPGKGSTFHFTLPVG